MAPTISIHGTLVNIFGSGVLLTGRSGIGKSEIALELVKKGQQLVADDRVEISQIRRTLMGSALEVSYGYMEIRGLGIFDLSKIFGINALKKSMKIDYVINLIELSDNAINIDRIGADKTVTYLNIDIPYIDLPVSLGRNMADIVEIATTILRLKDAGVVNSDDFEKRILAFRENL
jgi:HPr kinase/phosphorylase